MSFHSILESLNPPNFVHLNKINIDDILSSEDITRFKVVVFDFDHTLLKIHSSNLGIKPGDIKDDGNINIPFSLTPKKIRDIVGDCDFIHKLIPFLIEHRIKVIIASFGHHLTIKRVCEVLFPHTEWFQNSLSDIKNKNINPRVLHTFITTPDDFIDKIKEKNPLTSPSKSFDGTNELRNKNIQLNEIAILLDVQKDNILFFDDDNNNINCALNNNFSRSFCVPKITGFTRYDWIKAIRHA